MRIKNRLLAPILSFAIFASLTAGLIVSANSGKQDAQTKIASWVIEHTTGGQQTEFIVVMKEQADLALATNLRAKHEKGTYVRNALYAKAQAWQASLLEWLRARGIEHRSFYIVNAVLVRSNRAVAETIAARTDVERIDGNPTIRNLEPVSLTPEEIEAAMQQALSPQVVEPGVNFIRAPEVWAMGFTGQGIVIGGADTGVQWNHPALINKYRGWDGAAANHDFNWHDSIHSGGGSCGPNSAEPCDDHNHGTHTVGTAVGADASNTNQIGVAPGAKFIACRNMDQGVGTPARYIECMEWFLAPYPVGGTPAEGDPARAPDLTTNSWSCPPDEGCQPATLQRAVEAQRAAGIMFVAAAGNSGSACSTVEDPPSFYDATYTAGAFSSSTGNIASFSSRGPVTADGSTRIKPDITAPGVSVRSAIRGGGYASFSGTSMATPHTAGAVALLWSARPALRNQIDQTEDVVNQAAVDVATTSCNSSDIPNNVYGWGRLDIKAAVDQSANPTGLQYYPLPRPVRLLDTRPGHTACNAPGTPLVANATFTQPARVNCDGISIPASAAAIVGNATIVNFISPGGYVTLYPSGGGGASRPTVSNLNFTANQIIPNSFTVALGSNGSFDIFTSGGTHFIVDITGYYAPPGAGGLYYHPLPTPVRLFDSRPGEQGCDAPGAPLANEGTRTVLAHRTCLGTTIPSSARSIVGTATVVNFISSGFHWITLYPFGTPQPNASNLNFTANQIIPNAFVVGLSSDGKFNIYSHAATHFIVDVTGYFSPDAVDANGAGLLFTPLPLPVRLLETRPGELGCNTPGTPLSGGATLTQPARGTCNGITIPANAQSVVGNATVVNFISNGGWITLYPSGGGGAALPLASNLNYTANQIIPNAFTVGLGNDGAFNIFASANAGTHFIVDLSGYFAP
jgi:subtilisin family serine protease